MNNAQCEQLLLKYPAEAWSILVSSANGSQDRALQTQSRDKCENVFAWIIAS